MSRNAAGFVFSPCSSVHASVNWTVCQTGRDTNCCRVSSRRRVSGWHSCWTVPAHWAGSSSSRCSVSPSCSSTTVSPSHPTAYICCCCSRSEYGTALLSGTSKGSCSSGCWLWCLRGAGLQVTQVGHSSYYVNVSPACWFDSLFMHNMHKPIWASCFCFQGTGCTWVWLKNTCT